LVELLLRRRKLFPLRRRSRCCRRPEVGS
jgi:hypothetical protein